MKPVRTLPLLAATAVWLAACASHPSLGSTFSLPHNVWVSPPTAAAPGGAAVFSGGWTGTWLTPGYGPGYDGLLVVERLDGDQASILYAWGNRMTPFDNGWYRQTARIGPGPVLSWQRGDWTFQFRPEHGGKTLAGLVRERGSDAAIVTMRVVSPKLLAAAPHDQVRRVPPLPVLPPLASMPPAPDLPSGLAGIWGKWEGVWDSGVAGRLIVSEINRAGAKVLYAWSADPKGTFNGGEIARDALAYGDQRKITFGAQPRFTFRLSPDGRTLEGESERDGQLSFVLMQRATN